MNTSKPIVATPEAERLAEAYAILRQVRFYLQHPNPTPRTTDDVKTTVREFCEAYEAEIRGTHRLTNNTDGAQPVPTNLLPNN